IAEASVIGHSMGGYLGLLLAAQHGQRVRRLVTIATAGLSPRVQLLFEDLGRLSASIPAQDWFRLLYQWLFSEPFFADPRNVAAAAEASAAYPWRQSPADFARQFDALKAPAGLDAAAIRCPVLALAAERDLLVTPAMVAATHAAIPGHRLETIPGAAHSIHWEAPQAVAESVLSFLG